MIQLKSCPRCRGDMMIEDMLGTVELVCLQCGHRGQPPADKPATRRRPAPAATA